MIKRKLLTLSDVIKKAEEAPEERIVIEDIRSIPVVDSSNYGECLEEHYIDNVLRDLFFELCEAFRLDINNVFSKTPSLREKHRFNMFLRSIKQHNGFRIIDSLIFLEEKNVRFIQAIKQLDQENEYSLKMECAEIDERYKEKPTHLKDFLEFDKIEIV